MPGDVVARYSGKPLTRDQADLLDSDYYVLEVSFKLFLDVTAADNWEGRFINDGPHSGRPANCAFASAYNTNAIVNSDRRWVKVFVTRPISPGDELLISYYGDRYWDSHARPPGRAAAQFVNIPSGVAARRRRPRACTHERKDWHVRSNVCNQCAITEWPCICRQGRI